MDNLSLSQIIDEINQQTNAQELLNQHLLEAEALTHVTITTDFLTLSKNIIYSYLAVLSNVVVESRELSEKLLNTLLILQKNIYK